MKSVALVLFVAFCNADGLILPVPGVKCGVKLCRRDEYCGTIQKTCESCIPLCDQASHNYDQPECLQQCQGYLQDLNINQTFAKKETVQSLSHTVTLSLVLNILVLVVLVLILAVLLYKYKKENNITLASIKKNLSTKKRVENPANANGDHRPDLHIEIPPHTGSQSDVSPVTLSTSIGRKPAEDSTLDYAYENQAMDTPSPDHKSRNEGRF